MACLVSTIIRPLDFSELGASESGGSECGSRYEFSTQHIMIAKHFFHLLEGEAPIEGRSSEVDVDVDEPEAEAEARERRAPARFVVICGLRGAGPGYPCLTRGSLCFFSKLIHTPLPTEDRFR